MLFRISSIYLLVTASFLCCWSSHAQGTKTFTELTVIDVKCFFGSRYAVRVVENFPDQEIAVIEFNGGQEYDCLSGFSPWIISLTPIDYPRYVVDLKGPYLLLESGCCPGFSGLEIYNLDSREVLYTGA